MKPVLVSWVDIMTYGDRVPLSVAKEAKLAKCFNMGVLLHEDDEKIIVGPTGSCIPGVPELTVQDYTVIPKGCIKYIKTWKVNEIKNLKNASWLGRGR